MWLAVWPGVVTASMAQPSPATTSPSFKATSGTKIAVGTRVERIMFADMQRPRGAVRTFSIDGSACRRLDRRHRRRMIAMSMCDKNMRHSLVANGIEERADMRFVIRTGIDDRDLATTDDVANGSLESEWAGIVGHDTSDACHRLVDSVRRDGEVFVERDVVGHAVRSNLRNRPTTISAIVAPMSCADAMWRRPRGRH